MKKTQTKNIIQRPEIKAQLHGSLIFNIEANCTKLSKESPREDDVAKTGVICNKLNLDYNLT